MFTGPFIIKVPTTDWQNKIFNCIQFNFSTQFLDAVKQSSRSEKLEKSRKFVYHQVIE